MQPVTVRGNARPNRAPGDVSNLARAEVYTRGLIIFAAREARRVDRATRVRWRMSVSVGWDGRSDYPLTAIPSAVPSVMANPPTGVDPVTGQQSVLLPAWPPADEEDQAAVELGELPTDPRPVALAVFPEVIGLWIIEMWTSSDAQAEHPDARARLWWRAVEPEALAGLYRLPLLAHVGGVR